MHKVDPETLETTKKVSCDIVVSTVLQVTFSVFMGWSATVQNIKLQCGCKGFLCCCLKPVGWLEQIHRCKRCNCSPSHWAGWNNIQHGEFLHLQRYFRETESIWQDNNPVVSDNLSQTLTVFVLTGAYYNIIVVPPTKETAEETLEGATVLCSIPSGDKTKPSYYHSFGEQTFPSKRTYCVNPVHLLVREM